jgi:two-component system sensor histidine kinase HydH
VLFSYGIALTVARPLGAVTAAMREMSATGDLTRRIAEAQASAWNDEDARLLATTFNTMTASIERFQREATLRERLSSLGRLSTVIAHEIRNPLMIIKASVRLLKRPDAKAEDIRATVADIEGEIARLNRIVSEVLDFSRPISFDRAPSDVNAICRSAAQAVDADDAPVRVALRLQEGLPPLVTDAERLRQALVNVLDNARQAAAAQAGAGQAPSVELSTSSEGGGRLVLTVRDNGPGIAAEDLPRVFEPYFTTRRAGSGLGLAITKNIVEGLGGTVRVSSRPGEGTDIQVDFPLEP